MIIVLEFKTFVYVAVNFYGYVVDSLVSGGGCGHSNVSVGCVVSTQSVLYCYTKENRAQFQWRI